MSKPNQYYEQALEYLNSRKDITAPLDLDDVTYIKKK